MKQTTTFSKHLSSVLFLGSINFSQTSYLLTEYIMSLTHKIHQPHQTLQITSLPHSKISLTPLRSEKSPKYSTNKHRPAYFHYNPIISASRHPTRTDVFICIYTHRPDLTQVPALRNTIVLPRFRWLAEKKKKKKKPGMMLAQPNIFSEILSYLGRARDHAQDRTTGPRCCWLLPQICVLSSRRQPHGLILPYSPHIHLSEGIRYAMRPARERDAGPR